MYKGFFMKDISLVVLLLAFFIVCVTCCTNRTKGKSAAIEETNVPPSENFSQKEDFIWLYRPADNNRQNIYILGTIHQGHFDKQNNYPLADVQSVIDEIRPDLLLVEVRQETFEKYGALDGPTEMVFAWSYANEKGIYVSGIDYWYPSLGLPNTTFSERDDHIFDNIISASNKKENILVLIGCSHLFPLDRRFISHGYRRIKIANKERYFRNSSNIDFAYPDSYEDRRDKYYDYYNNIFPDEVYAIPEDNPFRESWIKHITRNRE
jgi:hypothetical protein